jgi:hypothetical protein
MNRVPVADWAASVPWNGITGKPAGIGQPTDLSQITWSSVQANKVPLWNGTRFVPVALPVFVLPSSIPTFISTSFNWNPDPIPGGEQVSEEFTINGASFGDQIIYGVPNFIGTSVLIQSQIVAPNRGRVTLSNFGTTIQTVDSGLWKFRVLK